MRSIKLFFLIIVITSVSASCSNESTAESPKTPYLSGLEDTTKVNDSMVTIDTEGYMDNGQIVSRFDCPDSRFFPPIDLKNWEKTPVVNNRLPTYKETINGTSIHTYGGSKNKNVKPYHITLPRLAYFINGPGQVMPDSSAHKMVVKPQLVVVIQVVQTLTDTLVGYRYLTGGVGGSFYRDFRFVDHEEANKLVAQAN